MGCYDDSGARLLSSKVTNTNDMTVAECFASCAGYSYFGTEYGIEYWCGNTQPSDSKNPEADCNIPCIGDDSQVCGAGYRLSVYLVSGSSYSPSLSSGSNTGGASGASSGSSVSPSSAASTSAGISPATVTGFAYQDCYVDNIPQRVLADDSTNGSTMKTEKCAAYCSTYTWFGVEYSTECYCGASLDTGSNRTSEGDCGMTCAGNSAESCGGLN
jgi:hypothetical protein